MGNKGIALLITMVLLGTIMATAMGVAVLVVGETGANRLVNDSMLALFAADAGAEKMFLACSNKIPYPVSAYFTATLESGAEYEVHMDDNGIEPWTDSCNDTRVVSKGIKNTAQRSFEAVY